MKTMLALAVIVMCACVPARAQEDADIGMFYSSLGSEGEWIPVDGGNYVWHPSGVDPDWRPYTDGHWVWTDDGWYWASDEPWAWATYHYGRWYYDDTYGWVWMPGYEWAPAWVEWRYGDDCIGWAPLSPYAVFSVNWGVHYRRYWATPYYYWSFVDCRYMGYGDMHRYIYRTSENARFIGRTRTAGSVRYDGGRIVTRGPEREYVERRGGVQIPRASLVDVRERGQAGMIRESGGERIGVYRPRIEGGTRGVTMERPGRVRADDHPMNFDMRGTDIRRAAEVRAPRENMRAPVERQAPAVRPNYQPREMARPERPLRTPERPADVRQQRPERRNEVMNSPRGGGWSRPERTYAPAGRSGGGRVESPARGGGGGGRTGGGGGRGGRR